jgi:hypothetical protein
MSDAAIVGLRQKLTALQQQYQDIQNHLQDAIIEAQGMVS